MRIRRGWLRGPWIPFLGVVVLGIGGAAAIAEAPRLLRRFDAFDVRRVEVRGTRYLPPHDALAASGIVLGSNLFDDLDAFAERLRAHALVEAVEVERRLPGTLILHVAEVEPVALVRGDVLRPVDRLGRVLPIDPAELPLDLPIVPSPGDAGNGRSGAAAAVALVAELSRIRRLEPSLATRVSEVAPVGADAIRLRLREPAQAAVLLARGAEPLRLRQVLAVLADLERRQELHELERLDGRYGDQIVVAWEH